MGSDRKSGHGKTCVWYKYGTTIEFDDLEVDVPKARGPDGRDLGGATWKLNGKVVWTTEARRNQASLQ